MSTMIFTLKKGCCWFMFSLFALGNNFPTDHTEDIGCNFVFTDWMKRLKIPFSWYLYHLYRFKEVNLALLSYYQPAWHTCGRYTMEKILLNPGRLGTKTSILKYSAATYSVTAHRLEIYKRKDVRWKNWKKGNENVWGWRRTACKKWCKSVPMTSVLYMHVHHQTNTGFFHEWFCAKWKLTTEGGFRLK